MLISERVANAYHPVTRITEEAKIYYDSACEEIDKLSKESKLDWGLIDCKFFDETMYFSLVEGLAIGLLIPVGVKGIKKLSRLIKRKLS